jgi:orotate phosphoribosyltransferase
MTLAEMIRKYALKTGEFTLASGKKSSFYLDVKRAYTRPEVMKAIVESARAEIQERGLEFDRVAGVALGAVPLAAVLCLELGVPFVMLRKEKKGHGTGNAIEGELNKGERVLLVEDVTTSGGSVLAGIEAVRASGALCDTVLTVVDRGEGAKGLLNKHGIDLVSLVGPRDLGLEV